MSFAKRPNILIFMTDQQRGDTIPPYSRAKTPNLEKFCKEGITFSNAYTISPHCCPSRATFFSGLYPSQHGVWNNVSVGNTLSKGLYEGIKLWSEDFSDAGYDMYFSGKWHVSALESPLDRGFHTLNITNPEPVKDFIHEKPDIFEWKTYFEFEQDMDRKEADIIRKGYPKYSHYGIDDNPFKDRDVVEDAVKQINSREENGKPWCRFIGTLGPHDAYYVPEKYLDMYRDVEIELPENFEDKMQDKPALYRRTRDRFDQLSEKEHIESIRHYLAFCTYEDALFGEVLDALEKSGEKENTLVLFMSDHGDYAGEHGLWCKGLPCFKGAYHIPLAVRWPEGIENPGRNIESYVTLADFAPTFLELADIEKDREFMGSSLVDFLKDEEPEICQSEIYTQSNGNELYGIQRSVMTKDWKLVYNGFDYDELYDLKNDLYETNNLIEEKEYEEIIRELYKKIWKFAYKADDVCINQYIMVGLAGYGPGIAFED